MNWEYKGRKYEKIGKGMEKYWRRKKVKRSFNEKRGYWRKKEGRGGC